MASGVSPDHRERPAHMGHQEAAGPDAELLPHPAAEDRNERWGFSASADLRMLGIRGFEEPTAKTRPNAAQRALQPPQMVGGRATATLRGVLKLRDAWRATSADEGAIGPGRHGNAPETNDGLPV